MSSALTAQQVESWKKVRTAGTVTLILGWIGLGFSVLVLILTIIFTIFSWPITNDNGTTTPSWVLALIYGIVLLGMFVPFAIVNIIAGIKLRKPAAKPKGWLIYAIVAGGLAIGGGVLTIIPGVLQMVFAILAIVGFDAIEGTEPPEVK